MWQEVSFSFIVGIFLSVSLCVGIFVTVVSSNGGIYVEDGYGWECTHSKIDGTKALCIEYKRNLE